MANPSKQRPWAIEYGHDGRWYAVDAFRTEPEAREMEPVYAKRAEKLGTRVRIRDISKAEGRS